MDSPYYLTPGTPFSDLAAMTGLVGYGSSDEEDFIHHDQGIQLKSQVTVSHVVTKHATIDLLLIGKTLDPTAT